jgi:hypothetical protein
MGWKLIFVNKQDMGSFVRIQGKRVFLVDDSAKLRGQYMDLDHKQPCNFNDHTYFDIED